MQSGRPWCHRAEDTDRSPSTAIPGSRWSVPGTQHVPGQDPSLADAHSRTPAVVMPRWRPAGMASQRGACLPCLPRTRPQSTGSRSPDPRGHMFLQRAREFRSAALGSPVTLGACHIPSRSIHRFKNGCVEAIRLADKDVGPNRLPRLPVSPPVSALLMRVIWCRGYYAAGATDLNRGNARSCAWTFVMVSGQRQPLSRPVSPGPPSPGRSGGRRPI